MQSKAKKNSSISKAHALGTKENHTKANSPHERFVPKNLGAAYVNTDGNVRTVTDDMTFIRAFFGSIPEDFGNRGESTITLTMMNKQRQKHHKKRPNHGESNHGVLLRFFYELGTAV